MEEIHVLRIAKRAAGIVFPFDRVYLFPIHLEETIPRVFPNALVFPFTKRVFRMLQKVNRVCNFSYWEDWEHRYYPKQRPCGKGQPDWEVRDNVLRDIVENRKKFLGVVAQLYLQGHGKGSTRSRSSAAAAYVSAYQQRAHGYTQPAQDNKGSNKLRCNRWAEEQWEAFGDLSQGKWLVHALEKAGGVRKHLRFHFLRDIIGAPAYGYLLVGGKKHRTPCLACPNVMECTPSGISYGDTRCQYTNISSKYSPLVKNALGAMKSLQAAENNLGDGAVLEDADFPVDDWELLFREYLNEGNEE